MSTTRDGDGDAAAAPGEAGAAVGSTTAQGELAAAGVATPDGPAKRPSATQLQPPPSYPDDGPVSRTLREVDRISGLVEQIALFGVLLLMIGTAAGQTLATKLFGESLEWSFDVVRASTFAIGMVGAAFASRHATHLSMDVLSRMMPPRSRLMLRIVLALFTMFVSYLLLQSGLHLRANVATEGGSHTIAPDLIATLIPIGAALIIFHTAVHLLIDVDYLRRGKLPPEKAPSAH